MGQKYFTISFDDGIQQDIKVIELMKKYGIAGTFNLSSQLFGQQKYVKRIGDFGYTFTDKPARKTVPHFCLTKPEALQVYQGAEIEIASHGAHHQRLIDLKRPEVLKEIQQDCEELKELFNQEIVGHAFPYGKYGKDELIVTNELNLLYTRKMEIMNRPEKFYLRKKEGVLSPSCWILDPFSLAMAKEFTQVKAKNDLVFFIWGHSYELDYGTERGNWQHLESIFQLMASQSNIQKVTTAQLVTVLNK